MAARSKRTHRLSWRQSFILVIKEPFIRLKKRINAYMARRPHRSFRFTRRRDYRRSLVLPGYFAFTRSVNQTLQKHRKTFLVLAAIYAVGTGVFVGLGSQDVYSSLTGTLQETGSQVFQGNVGEVGKAALLLTSIATTGLTENVTDAQRIYGVLLVLLVWLTTVWLLRNILAGHKVRVRDGLYAAGSPIVSTLLVGLVLVVQLLPLALAIIGYSAAAASGLLSGGVEAMLFWIVAALLTTASLYLMTSTFLALIIVTLPGMYPMRALRTAGDMVVGRRIRILLRLLWMGLCIIVGWAIFMLPIILFDTWLKSTWIETDQVPIIPVALLVATTVTVIWVATYIYLLYRKIVDDDAKPA